MNEAINLIKKSLSKFSVCFVRFSILQCLLNWGKNDKFCEIISCDGLGETT